MNYKTVDELAKRIHEQNLNLGYWDKPNSFDMQLNLVTSEVFEFFEAHRKGGSVHGGVENIILGHLEYEDNKINRGIYLSEYKEYIKGTMEEELADIYIRCLDWAYWLNENEANVRYGTSGLGLNELNIQKIIRSMVQALSNMDEFEEERSFEGIAFVMNAVVEICHEMKIDLKNHVLLKLRYNLIKGRDKSKKY